MTENCQKSLLDPLDVISKSYFESQMLEINKLWLSRISYEAPIVI